MKEKLIIALALAASGVQAADLQGIKDADMLRVGVLAGTPPFGFVALDGDYYGFEVELAKKMAEDLLGDPDKVEFILINHANERFQFVKNDKVDVVFAVVTRTPEREKIVDFGKPYIKVQFGVLSHKKAPITSIDDLKGKLVGVPENTSADQFFSTKYPDVKLQRFATNPETYRNFRDGKVDALVDDNLLLYPWEKEYPALFTVALDHLGDVDVLAPVVKKGNTTLLDFINAEMDKFKTDGTLTAAWNRYLKPAYGETVKPADVLILE